MARNTDIRGRYKRNGFDNIKRPELPQSIIDQECCWCGEQAKKIINGLPYCINCAKEAENGKESIS